MTYTSDQYQRDKHAMLGEFHKAIADAKRLCKEATAACIDGSVAAPPEHVTFETGAMPAGAGTAVKTPEPAGDRQHPAIGTVALGLDGSGVR